MVKAKNFTLEDKDGAVVELNSLKSQYVVLYFYPKDDTPGCTLEARDFSKLKAEFEARGAVILGISGGDAKTKQKFCDKHDLSITLLSDTDFAVSTAYGLYGEKSFMGKRYMGITRTTFILDKNKNIIHTFENVKPIGHAKEVLAWLDSQ